MTMLETVENKQDLILLTEIGALIHDLGKLSKEFVHAKATDGWGDDVHHLFLQRYPPQVPDHLKEHLSKQNRVETALKYLDSVDIDQARDLHAYLEAEYQANPKLYLEGALRTYAKSHPTAQQLIVQVETIVEEHKKLSHPRYGELVLAERVAQIPDDFLPDASPSLLNSLALPTCPSTKKEPLLSETIIGDLIEGHHSPPAPWRVKRSEYLAMLRAPDGVDGFDSWVDKGQFPEEDRPFRQPFAETYIATAFGHEAQWLPVGPDEDDLKEVRYRFAEVLAEELGKVRDGKAKPAEVRPRIFEEAEEAFRQALGETRRAANDVTLWDHSYSVASLYKAALAKVLLEGKWTEPKRIGWRFLRVEVDGLRFFAQAHHVTDMLGRRQALMDALDKVREALEVDYPLGNEVYRDENGSVFVMPGLDSEEAHKKLAQEVEELILKTFRQTELGEELVPRLIWNDEGAVRRQEDGMPDMTAAFGKLVGEPSGPVTGDPKAMDEWWRSSQARGQEICTVCGTRPVGYDAPDWEKHEAEHHDETRKPVVGCQTCKTLRRKLCYACYLRRGRRARDWARNEGGAFHRTIWIDEVADDKGRFALVVGRFALEGWLDGKLVRTMLVVPGEEKNPSPARIRRCWETTHQFWRDLVEGREGRPPKLESVIEPRPFRLRITPDDAAKVNKELGPYHVYDWPLRGATTLSVVWVPDEREGGYFLTADNLWYLAGPEQLAFPEEALKNDSRLLYEFGRVINAQQEVALLEPSGYGRPAEVKVIVKKPEVKALCEPYTPYIPLLAEPAIFMVLVPADRALKVARAIKEKYDREMARVRDRLPLHLGLVFAPRRTPLSAVLEAGRAMLKMPARWEQWQVSAIGRKATFSRDGHVFEWEYPAKMGDEETKDIWYPHLLLANPESKSELSLEAKDFHRVDDLTDKVYIRPSRFDFVFLDTTARRFEIVYQPQTSEVLETSEVFRPSRRTRPYLLDDLDRLEKLWNEMCYLEKSQRHQVVSTIEATREAWFDDDRGGRSWSDRVFRQFVHDTLAGAAWPRDRKWADIPKETRRQLEDAGVTGELADLMELHMQILKEE